MSILYDLAVILILVAAAVKAYRSGFLATVIRLVGIFVIIALSAVIARAGASLLFRTLVEAPVRDYLAAHADAITDTETLAETVTLALEELSPAMQAMLGIDGIDGDRFAAELEAAMSQSLSSGIDFLASDVLRPPIEGALTLVIFLLLFLLLLVVLGLVVRALRQVHWVPVVGPLNALAGGAVGLVEGVVILMLLAFLAQLVIAFTHNTLDWLNEGLIDRTYLFRYAFLLNPLIGG